MWIYILNIILSSLLFIGADIVYRKNKHNYFYIFLLLGIILISSAISGFRGDTIGTDVLVYAEPLQRLANVTDKFSDYLNNNTIYWTMSPLRFDGGDAVVGGVSEGAVSLHDSDDVLGVRAAVNLSSYVEITGGNGTFDNPYVVN